MPLVEAGQLAGPDVEAAVAEALAPLLGERDAAGEFVFPLPASARIDTLLLGCTHYPLLRPVIAAVAGDGVAIVDSATATASRPVELLAINGLEAPADAAAAPPTHVQLTTGDVDRLPLGRGPAVRRRVPRRRVGRAGGGRLVTTGGEAGGRPAWRDDRLWQAGFLVGSALGAAATVLGRRAERVARRGLVDWPRAERIAVDRLRVRARHA